MDFSSIDARSSDPLYLQIRWLIAKAIQTQELLPGQCVPSVSSISASANVSKMTVRQALHSLVNEGWLYTVPGKGTFVTENANVVLDLRHLLGWSDDLKAQGIQPSTRLVSTGIVRASALIARELNISENASVFKISRVQLAAAAPLSLDTTFLSVERFPSFDKLVVADPTSISRILQLQYGVYLMRASQFVDATGADEGVAELLNIAVGTPVLLVQRTTFTLDQTPVQFVQSIHRSGLVRFKLELTNTQLV